MKLFYFQFVDKVRKATLHLPSSSGKAVDQVVVMHTPSFQLTAPAIVLFGGGAVSSRRGKGDEEDNKTN